MPLDVATLISQTASGLLWLCVGTISILLFVFVLRNIVWMSRYPFLLLNWIQWILYNPLRDTWTNHLNSKSAWMYAFLRITLIAPIWWLSVHVLLTPLRLINAIYFNIILYWSIVFCDSLSELFQPRLKYGRTRGIQAWLRYFPVRLYNVFKRNGAALFEGILMTGVDTVLPTFTMYHGTSFKGIATNIAQEGRWYVGGGDYAGCGIYFGFFRKTAEHYAQGDDRALICARVTIFPCRNSATLPRRLRKKIGSDGTGISKGLPFPYKSIEHWRNHSYAQWFEYCLVQPGLAGNYVRTWRARPICVLKNGLPKRIWGGLSLWTGGAGGFWAIVLSWLTIALVILAYLCGWEETFRAIRSTTMGLMN
jgi:hypothetical protein